MSVYSAEFHSMMPQPAAPASASATPTATAPAAAPDEDLFHHLLNIVNPLQHLPVVGTIYRAITGEHIDAFDKIAGDSLYGGMWGAITSVADVAFEKLTGKDVEDTVEDTLMAWLKPGDDGTAVAQAATAPASQPAGQNVASNIPAGADVAALSGAMAAKGIDGDVQARALYAYRQSMGITDTPVLSSLH